MPALVRLDNEEALRICRAARPRPDLYITENGAYRWVDDDDECDDFVVVERPPVDGVKRCVVS